MKYLFAFLLCFSVLNAATTKVGGSGKTKVGGSGKTQVFPVSSTFTLITSDNLGNAASGTTLVTTAITGVAVGDLIVAYTGNQSSNTATLSDGTSAFTSLTAGSNGTSRGQIHYLLASTVSGSVTYTATFAGASTDRSMVVLVFRPSVPCVLDVAGAIGTASGTTAYVAPNITTTSGSAWCVVAEGLSAFSAQPVAGSWTINGVLATAGRTNSYGALVYYLPTATFTGGSTMTWNASNNWIAQLIAFKIP